MAHARLASTYCEKPCCSGTACAVALKRRSAVLQRTDTPLQAARATPVVKRRQPGKEGSTKHAGSKCPQSSAASPGAPIKGAMPGNTAIPGGCQAAAVAAAPQSSAEPPAASQAAAIAAAMSSPDAPCAAVTVAAACAAALAQSSGEPPAALHAAAMPPIPAGIPTAGISG